MKKKIISVACFMVFVFIFFNVKNTLHSTKISKNHRLIYENFIKKHKYSNHNFTNKELTLIPKKDRPDLAWEQDFIATMNPNTGRPEKEKVYEIIKEQKQKQRLRIPGVASSPWVERGPNNVGGRTRAIAWDPTTNNKVWAGSVAGGLWFNNDITNNNSSWQVVNDFWENLAISAIKFDPNNNQIIYVGTGEGFGNLDAVRGAGIFKSIDGGLTFNQLSATTGFNYINDLVIRNELGVSVIYAALNNSTLQRSIDGGITWTNVFSSIKITDLDIASDNKLWLGGSGKIYSSVNGTTFNLKHTYAATGRVNLACAPSNVNYVYAAFVSGSVLGAFKQTTDGGTTWNLMNEPNDADTGIPATDFTRNQAWYDLTLDVDPTNENNVMIGGVDLFKTTDGGTSWQQMTHWYGGFGFQNLHADQHTIVYKDNSSSEVIFGNDGGVGYTNNGNVAIPTISARIKDYNVTQFYAGAIHPTAGTNIFLAGAQDNGSHRFTTIGVNSTIEVTGGDGAFCHIDQTNGAYQTTSYVYNTIHYSSNGGLNFSNILSDQTTGRFINPSDLDNNQNILYTYRNLTSLYRITNFESGAPVVGTITTPNLGSAVSHLSVSPYTTGSTTIFIGTAAGRVFKITNANATPISTEITGAVFPSGSVSCITFGQNENELLVTFSNYGVNSIWYTNDGGTTWVSKEGNLPNMPVRWALFNPTNYNEVILATEVGVWKTYNISVANPIWTTSSVGLGNVRVDMLQYRSSDNEVIAATHGRGLFSSDGFNGPTPFVVNFTANTTITNATPVIFTDQTNLNPTSWAWTFTPNTVTYVNGTNANSQNPEVLFNNNGLYTVSLTASNATNTGTATKIDYINETPIYCNSVCNSFSQTDVHNYVINSVNFNTINNVSLNTTNTYSDFTAITTDVVSGSSYDLTIDLYTLGNIGYNSRVIVWIDWNRDCDFNDINEEYLFPNSVNAGTGATISIPIPINASLGATRMRISMRNSSPANEYTTSCQQNGFIGEVEDYTLNILPVSVCSNNTKTWNGSVWSPSAPTINDPVIIAGNYFTNVLNGSFECCTLTINNNILVSVQGGYAIKVKTDIINNGQFNINNQGALVQVNDLATVTGNGNFVTTVQTTVLQDTDRFTYFSSPTSTSNLSVFNNFAGANWSYNNSTQQWAYIGNGSATNVMTQGVGYAVQGGANTTETVNFLGAFNNGEIQIPLSFNVYNNVVANYPDPAATDDDSNLVGNPYPSAISASDLINNNDINAVFIWTHASPLQASPTVQDPWVSNDYIECIVGTCTDASGTTGVHTGLIASGQGFFVTATAATNLVFNNSLRRTTGNNQFRNSNNEFKKVWLDMTTTQGYNRQIALTFTTNGSSGFDNKFESKNFGNGYGLGFYSFNNESDKLTINDTGLLDHNERVIPLGYYINSNRINDLTIAINHLENFENEELFLKDNLLHTIHNLKVSDYYLNNIEIGEVNDRFEIVIRNNALNTESIDMQNESLIIYTENNSINIKTNNNSLMKNITIYDILGKKIKSLNINKPTINIPLNNIDHGTLLILKTVLENGIIINKKYIY